MPLEYIIQRQNPFLASRVADEHSRAENQGTPERLAYFSARSVLTPDGDYPFGEGYLYRPVVRNERSPKWNRGAGRPSRVAFTGHQGTKREQQDAFGGLKLELDGDPIALVAVADGVSASGSRAAPAARCAMGVFQHELRGRLQNLPNGFSDRHEAVEWAIGQSLYRANFEVIRHVLFDFDDDGFFGPKDSEALYADTGVLIPTGPLTTNEMRTLACETEVAVDIFARASISALTTFAAAVAIGTHVYTVSSGDAVISLFRPSEEEGKRLIHLTRRDQQVVEFYTSNIDIRPLQHIHENIITRSIGSSTELSATVRRFADLLEPGDRLMASSDGLGPRRRNGGLDRHAMEWLLDRSDGVEVVEDLVEEQLSGIRPGDYQDNIAVSLMTVQ